MAQFDVLPIAEISRLYFEKNTLKNSLKKELEELKEKLISHLKGFGTEESDGSITMILGSNIVRRTLAVSIKMNLDEAVELCKDKGLDCYIIVEKGELIQEEFEDYVKEGEISSEELEKITTVDTSQRLTVKALPSTGVSEESDS